MVMVKAVLTLISWLSHEIYFSQGASAFLLQRPHGARPNVDAAASLSGLRQCTAIQQSRSVNDDAGGFHYDQEPRGTSFISQVSKQDLWERRQMKLPRPRTRPHRGPPPNSRGAFAQEHSSANGADDFDEFKDNVSINLNAMTDLLKEMQRSQSIQNTDVQALSLKVAEMADRLSAAEAKNRMVNRNSPTEMENKNFGTSLDGEFNQKIKDVVDESAPNTGDSAWQQGGEYHRTKTAQIENRISRIDQSLQAMEEKIDSQMEYVDQRFDEIMDDATFDGMQFNPGPPPEAFLEQRPLPPPPEELPPPPPPPQEIFDSNPYYDDGTRYYQERNYDEPNVPPRLVREIGSSLQGQSGESVNERSGGHHYKEKNRSFISAFSRADNQSRKRFDPLGDQRWGERMSSRDQLPRGPPPRRGGFAVPSPEPMSPHYFEGPDYYGDGPFVDGPMMEEDYLHDEMYEF